MLKLGLDVHLEFIMAVAQKDHANPQAPRKFTNDELAPNSNPEDTARPGEAHWRVDSRKIVARRRVLRSCGGAHARRNFLEP